MPADGYGAVPGTDVVPEGEQSHSFDVAEIDDGGGGGEGGRLGTFFGVFVPCISSMFGVVSFLRLSTIVGHAGFWGTFVIIGVAFTICFLTVLSLCALITHGEILGGGIYHAIRNACGSEWGGALGVVFYLTYVSGVSFSLIGFAEIAGSFFGLGTGKAVLSNMPLTWVNTCIASAGLGIVTLFALRGARFSSQVSTLVFMFIVLSISSSLVCLLVPTNQAGLFTAFSPETFDSNSAAVLKTGTTKYSFFGLLVLFFPDFMGVVAGCNLSGELKRAAHSIPRGTIGALFVALFTYLTMALVQSGSVSRRNLLAMPFVMETVSDSVTGMPIVFAGVTCATLNIALNHMLGGSRVLQALGRDRFIDALAFFEPNHRQHGEPWRAIIMTWALCQCMLFVGSIDAMAPVTTGCFLVTFACINLACFVQSVSSRTFAPKFKFYSLWSALLGALLSTVAFFACATGKTVIFAVGALVLGIYLKRNNLFSFLRTVAHGEGAKPGSKHHLPEVEKLLLQSDVQKRVRRAAAYVRDALHGRFQGDEWNREEEDAHRISVKKFFQQLSMLRALNVMVFLGIAFMERPAWCYNVSCGDPKVVLNSWSPWQRFPVSVTLLIELVCLFGFSCEMVLKAAYMGAAAFFSNNWHTAQLGLVLMDFASILMTFMAQDRMPLMPIIRPILFVCYSRRVRKAMVSLFKVIPSFLDCALLIVLLILFFALFGMLLFQASPEGDTYFPTLGESSMSLLVLLTTANFPDVMLPAYREHRSASLFFIAFVSIGVYFFMNLVLATIYHNYRKQCEANAALFRQRRADALGVAFQLLDINGTGSLEFSVCQALLVELERPLVSIFDWRTSQVTGMERASNRLSMLSENPTHGINSAMFTELISNIKLKLDEPGNGDVDEHGQTAERDRELAAEACCSLFLSRRAQLALGRIVRNRMFEGAVDVLILVNCVLIVVETEFEMHDHSGGIPVLEAVEPIFTLIYVVELLLKLVVLGWDEYWRKLRNRFDLLVVGLLVLVEVDMLFSVNEGNKWSWIRWMLIVRLLRCLRLLVAVRRFNTIFATFLQLVPAFVTLFGMLFALMTLYAQLGVQAFGGKIYVGNPDLKDTMFAKDDYYVNNFNDYGSAMVTLFELLAVNHWNVIMDGVVATTGSKYYRLYFISFYAVAVVMVLNLVVAFILEAFFEKEMEGGEGGMSREELMKSPMMSIDDNDNMSDQHGDPGSNPHFVTLEETL